MSDQRLSLARAILGRQDEVLRQQEAIWRLREQMLALGPPPAPHYRGRADEAFIGEIARLYAWHLAMGERPNVAISRALGVPLRTVGSWIYRARKSGVLPEATQGRGRA